MEFLAHSWPFILGFIAEGEVALLFWLLQFSDTPGQWFLILAWAGTLSFLSFEFYYALGYHSHHILRRVLPRNWQQKIQPYQQKRSLFALVLFLRFLYGVRNPLAVWLGWRKYSPWRFLAGNLIGVILWLAALFTLFYFVRESAQSLLQEYRSLLLWVYLTLLAGFVLYHIFSRRG